MAAGGGGRTPLSLQSKPKRWQIWEIQLDPAKGREQKGTRLCLVISSDALNQSNFGTIIICPITTKHRESFKWRPAVIPADLTVIASDWEARPHWVETDQIATIDVQLGAKRPLAELTNGRKKAAVISSIRMMLWLDAP